MKKLSCICACLFIVVNVIAQKPFNHSVEYDSAYLSEFTLTLGVNTSLGFGGITYGHKLRISEEYFFIYAGVGEKYLQELVAFGVEYLPKWKKNIWKATLMRYAPIAGLDCSFGLDNDVVLPDLSTVNIGNTFYLSPYFGLRTISRNRNWALSVKLGYSQLITSNPEIYISQGNAVLTNADRKYYLNKLKGGVMVAVCGSGNSSRNHYLKRHKRDTRMGGG